MEIIQVIAIVLAVVGALNWGLVGLFKWDLVAFYRRGTQVWGDELVLSVGVRAGGDRRCDQFDGDRGTDLAEHSLRGGRTASAS